MAVRYALSSGSSAMRVGREAATEGRPRTMEGERVASDNRRGEGHEGISKHSNELREKKPSLRLLCGKEGRGENPGNPKHQSIGLHPGSVTRSLAPRLAIFVGSPSPSIGAGVPSLISDFLNTLSTVLFVCEERECASGSTNGLPSGVKRETKGKRRPWG